MDQSQTSRAILLFDGTCGLCNRAVRFILRFERKPLIKFAALDTEIANKLLDQFTKPKCLPDSIIFIENEKIYFQMDAVIRIGLLMGGVFKTVVMVKAIPRKWRNKLYNFVAKNRLQFFGTASHCGYLPGVDKARFLDITNHGPL